MNIPISIGIYQDIGGGDPLVVCNPTVTPIPEVIALLQSTITRLAVHAAGVQSPPAAEGEKSDTSDGGSPDPGGAADPAPAVPGPASDPGADVPASETDEQGTDSGADEPGA